MKKLISIIACSALLSGTAFAGGYIEGQLGYSWIDDVDLDGSISDASFGTATAALEYDDAIHYGLEVGIEGFESHNVFRIGLSWNRLEADLDNITGTITGGTQYPADVLTAYMSAPYRLRFLVFF